MTKFTDLGLAAPILQVLAKEGYETPTPIQAQAIPSILAGRDLQGIAQTGTGKTAAYALPIVHHLLTNKKPAPKRGARVLVLAPTRELASQIAQSFRTYSAGMNLQIATVFGGVPYGAQLKALGRGLDVLVATPGRLEDHLDSHNAQLRETEFLVLDEVDQMLDLGFSIAIRRIAGELPKERQNLFFSATMPREIAKLASELLVDPVEVSVAPVASTVERVQQQVIMVEARRKREILVELFADETLSRTIVFTRTKHGADKVALHLEDAGISARIIHGGKSQGQREQALAAFRAGRARALIATDIAARGIDIDKVTHVINFELPEVAESYVHRIGRTGRAGATGIAISLCDGSERNLLQKIERLTRQKLDTTDRRSKDGYGAPGFADDRGGERSFKPRKPAPRPGQSYGNGGSSGNGGDFRRAEQGQREWTPMAPSPGNDNANKPAFGRGPRRPQGDAKTAQSIPSFRARRARP